MKILFIVLFFIFFTQTNYILAQTAITANQLVSPTIIKDHPIEGFTNKIEEAVIRVERIATKISTRLEKMKKNEIKTSSFESRLRSIQRQIGLLDNDWVKAKSQATKTIGSQNPQRDYKTFRAQIVRVRNRLEIIVEAEKSLIDDMKQYASVSPTIKAMEGR